MDAACSIFSISVFILTKVQKTNIFSFIFVKYKVQGIYLLKCVC